MIERSNYINDLKTIRQMRPVVSHKSATGSSRWTVVTETYIAVPKVPERKKSTLCGPCCTQYTTLVLIYHPRHYKGQSTFPDTLFLLAFLRARKFSQLEARRLLESYLGRRDKLAKWFKDVDPADPRIRNVLDDG